MTSPLGSTWTQRGCSSPVAKALTASPGAARWRLPGGPAARRGHLQRRQAALRAGGGDVGAAPTACCATLPWGETAPAQGRAADHGDGAGEHIARAEDNVKVLTLCGGAPVRNQVTSLAHGAHIVVGTPGRILDHLARDTLALAA